MFGNLDWAEFFSFISGIISLGAIGWVVFFKYRSKSEKLKPQKEDVEVATPALTMTNEMMERIDTWYNKVNTLYRECAKMQAEINDLKQALDETLHIIEDINEALKRQVGRKRYAETNICTVTDCTLRVPPWNTFRTEDEHKEKYVKLNQYLKQKQGNINTNNNETKNEL